MKWENFSRLSAFCEKISHRKRLCMVKNNHKMAFLWEKLPFKLLDRRMGVSPCGREGMFNPMGWHPLCKPAEARQISSWQHGFTPILRMVKNDYESASMREIFPLMFVGGKG